MRYIIERRSGASDEWVVIKKFEERKSGLKSLDGLKRYWASMATRLNKMPDEQEGFRMRDTYTGVVLE